jgi:hypothetical protein
MCTWFLAGNTMPVSGKTPLVECQIANARSEALSGWKSVLAFSHLSRFKSLPANTTR